MKKVITQFFSFLLILTIASIITTNAQPVKIALLEQHTGAWCGWCVDGSYRMDKMLEVYPNQIIGVKIHNGDSMAIAEQAILSSTLGITFYPSATVDRKYFNDSIGLSRGSWQMHCEESMLENPKVDVNLVYSINEQTRELYATISATMQEIVNNELRFNVYIVEDSVSGTGTGWDQSNYLSGRAGYEDNPYYTLPAKIVGYQHMKVVRAMLGGAWGEKGIFDTPAEEGKTYVHNFSTTLDPRWKIKDIHLVGLIQTYSTTNKQILNSCYGTVGTPILPYFELTANQPETRKVISQGNSFDKQYSVKNISDSTKTFILTAGLSQGTPADWTLNIIPGNAVLGKDGINASSIELTVEPQQTANFILQLTPGPTKGFGDASMLLEVKDEPEAIKSTRNISAISAEIENFQVISSGESQYSLSSIIKNMGHDDFFEITPDDFNTFINDFPNKRVIVWNAGVDYRPTANDINTMLSALSSNIPMVLYGNQMVSSLNTDGSLGYFGVGYNGWSTQGYGSAPWRVWLSGVANDPISGDFGFNTEGNLINWLITLMKVTNWQIAHPVLHLANDGRHVLKIGDTLNIAASDAIFAVRVVNNGNLYFLSSISPFVVKDAAKRNNLVDNSIKWVLGMLDVDDEFTSDADFSMEITPNPVESSAMILFRFGGSYSANLKFVLYDNLGNQVIVINNDNVTPGEYQIPMNTEALAAGSYRLAGYASGKVVSIPVVITR